MTLDDLFSDRRRSDGRERSRKLLGEIAGGLRAIANLGTTLQGAPSADPLPRRRDLYERSRATSAGDSRNLYAEARMRTDASLARMKAERDNRLAQAKINDIEARIHREEDENRRREARSAKQLEEADARIAATIKRSEKSGSVTTGRRGKTYGGTGTTVRWIDPSTGERYAIDRGTWDKSSHTLFDIIVESTRPAPDSRGYPSAEEWRRHCRDTYGRRRDSRDAFIISNLPGNSAALDYMRKMR